MCFLQEIVEKEKEKEYIFRPMIIGNGQFCYILSPNLSTV